MRAVTIVPRKPGSLQVADVPEPSLGKGQLLLGVKRVGVCGTDLDIIGGAYGEAPSQSPFLILGHESLCEVLETGQGVSGFNKGDLVVPTVRRPCPELCMNCRSGESDMCTTGHYLEHGIKGLNGFACEQSLTESGFAVRLPRSLDKVGVLLEPLTIVEKAVAQALDIQRARMRWEPRTALVLGAGAVGLLGTALLRLMDIEVTAFARQPAGSAKAALVSSTGATYHDATADPLDRFEGRFDFVLEATGSPSVALEAQNLCAVNGVVSYLGVYRSALASEDAGRAFSNLVLGNRVFFGSVNANISHYRSGVTHLDRIASKWNGFLDKMISRTVPSSRAVDAYSREEGGMKTVVAF